VPGLEVGGLGRADTEQDPQDLDGLLSGPRWGRGCCHLPR
jgi:hypothetical protein